MPAHCLGYREKEWFDLYPDMKLVHDEWIHWTKGGLNWNTMCADCHSTLVKKNYNPVKDTYNTTYSLINVSCEACHGPGKEHVEITESEAFKNDPDTLNRELGKLYMGKYTLPKQMVDDCARCHSLRTQYTSFYDHDGSYMDHYAPDLLRDGIYFADGQILGEVYVYASFIQSKMYAQNVKCNDCHNVHSLELKFKGNELCLQCHEPEKYDVKSIIFIRSILKLQNVSAVTCLGVFTWEMIFAATTASAYLVRIYLQSSVCLIHAMNRAATMINLPNGQQRL